MEGDTDRLRAERAYTDPVIGDDTLARMFEASASRNADRIAQRYKGDTHDRSLLTHDVIPAAPPDEFRGRTYRQTAETVHNLAAGIHELGVQPGDRVAIYSHTRMEWALADLAVLQAGGVVTTVYPESSPDRAAYLLDSPGATGVIVEGVRELRVVLGPAVDVDLSFVISIDALPAEVDDLIERADATVLTLGALHERGVDAFDTAAHEGRLDAREPGDLATIVYTSGTTGKPKGVQLTHRNIRSNVNQVYRRIAPRPDKPPRTPAFDADGRTLSFLPLAHVFERTVGHFIPLAVGATIAYAESTDTIADDVATVAPTTLVSVPRVYERIVESIRDEADAGLRARILDRAVACAREWARTDDPGLALRVRHALYDRLVYSTIDDRLGGNVDFFVSGGGSLSRDLAELFAGMGLPISEGYGLTETAPVISTNPLEDLRPGTLGPPVVEMEVRLDGSMLTADQRDRADGEIGELQVQGPNVTPGYWADPENTAAGFTDDGYFRTGDIVERTADDYLVFHERLKQLLVLSTGKNVAPGPIEDAFATIGRVSQVLVVGDGRKFVGALVVPNFEAIRRWADRTDVDLPADRAVICADDRVVEYIGEAVDRVNESLDDIERIKRFRLIPEEWTETNDLLTPTMKKKRRAIRDRYADDIEALYE